MGTPKSPKTGTHRIYSILGSQRFFYFVVGLFIFQAVWIAFTARYPMAFDEQFHLGIINLYSHQHGPFFAGQPIGADAYGAVARDPSYMYHYLMSFPYRLIAAVSHSATVQIITLRLFSVAFMAVSLLIFKRLLAYLKASPVMSNSILLVFVCIPVVPLLGAQINYDTLLIPLAALSVLWSLKVYASITSGKTDYLLLTQLAILCMFTSLVKYAFLPIFFVIIVMEVVAWFKTPLARKNVIITLRHLPRVQGVILAVLFVVMLGFFIERYGDNTIKYGTPIPECNQVLSVAECQSYSPWARNYEFIQTQPHIAWTSAGRYVGTWVHQSVKELVFTITSRFNSANPQSVDYFTPPELPIPYYLAWVAFSVGLASFLVSIRTLWHRTNVRLILLISGVYIAALGLQNFLDYKHLGQPVAIHGRYLLPVMPFLLFITFESIKNVIDLVHTRYSINIRQFQPLALSVFVFVFMIQGGGFVSFIVLSRSDWFWPQSSPSQSLNYYARRALNPIVVGD